MEVFYHHIYGYKKGLRNIILHTCHISCRNMIISRLEKEKIPFVIYQLGNDRINVFFGNELCIEIIKKINKSNLNEYTDEEDFMLGVMLGYDRLQQCERYLKRLNSKEKKLKVIS
ncbi:MAG: DUF2023 family protein [Bacillota bacterium]